MKKTEKISAILFSMFLVFMIVVAAVGVDAVLSSVKGAVNSVVSFIKNDDYKSEQKPNTESAHKHTVGCTALTNITISNSVTSIGNRAFFNCSSLASITFEGTVEQWKAITLGDEWNYNVPATEVICSDDVVALN